MNRARGLTVVEVLIVVIVLALLAAIVSPQFSRADTDNRMTTMRANLLDVRAQIRLYRTQHADKHPTLEGFIDQMTSFSNVDGQTSPRREGPYNFGPYLKALPVNPYTGAAKVGNGPAGSSDWYYDPSSGLFRANHDPAFISY